jgi:hypothetical protein
MSVAASPNVVKMQLSRGERRAISKRNPESVDIGNALGVLLYYVNASVGTPPQSVALQIDTGSSDVWMFGPQSCDPTTSLCLGDACKFVYNFCDCLLVSISRYGFGEDLFFFFLFSIVSPFLLSCYLASHHEKGHQSFPLDYLHYFNEPLRALVLRLQIPANICILSVDLSQSETGILLEQGSFSIKYFTPGSGVTGDYISDVFGIGGLTIQNLTMAVATEAQSVSTGILGIGYSADESIAATGRIYPNIIDEMVNQGLIKSRAYSIWLDDIGKLLSRIMSCQVGLI